MKSPLDNATFLAFLTVLLWSTIVTAFKLALAELSPIQLVFYASLVSGLFLFIVVLFQRGMADAYSVFMKQPVLFIVSGLLNPFLYFWILFRAFDLLPAQQAQAINYTWPLVLSLLSVFFIGAKLKRADIFTLVLAYGGVVVIVSQGDIRLFNALNTEGVCLAFLSTFIWAVYWLINQKQRAPAVICLLINFSVSLPVILACMLWVEGVQPVSLKGFSYAAYIGLFEMGVTYVVWLRALRLTDNIARTNNIILITPFLSLFFINHYLEEPVTVISFVGLGVIVSAILLQKQLAR